jgi:hypothetical protein
MWPEFKPEITVGELAALAVTVLSAVLFLVRHWRQAHPFRVTFPKAGAIKEIEYDRPEVGQWTAPVGFSIVPVIVRNRFGTNLRWFSPRFGTKSYRASRRLLSLSWDNAPKDTIQIHALRLIPKRGVPAPHRRVWTDEVDVHFESYPWSSNEPLEFWLLIKASSEWSGSFAFYSRNEQHDRRRMAYVSARVSTDSRECDARPLTEAEHVRYLHSAEWKLEAGTFVDETIPG